MVIEIIIFFFKKLDEHRSRNGVWLDGRSKLKRNKNKNKKRLTQVFIGNFRGALLPTEEVFKLFVERTKPPIYLAYNVLVCTIAAIFLAL